MRSAPRKKRTGRVNPGQARRVTQNVYVVLGTVSGEDVESNVSESITVQRQWQAEIVTKFSGAHVATVEFDLNSTPGTTLDGTVVEGTANVGDLLVLPSGNTAVRSASGLLLGAGLIELT